MVFVVPVVGRGAGAVSAGEADTGRAGRASTAGAALAFSVVLCAREAVRVLALDVLGVALSALVRVVRLRVAGFTCSLASGDSDVLVMKKTPFYLVIATGSNTDQGGDKPTPVPYTAWQATSS